MNVPPSADVLVNSAIAWFYLVTNSLRGFTYLPQIVVVWRSKDGARSLSLLTWSAWLVAHIAAVLYGLVLRDAFFTGISLINFVGCSTVVGIAGSRRRQSNRLKRDGAAPSRCEVGPPSDPMPPALWNSSARAYVARWGCGPSWFAPDSAPSEHSGGPQSSPTGVPEKSTSRLDDRGLDKGRRQHEATDGMISLA
ncbi:MAG: hypothetical protein ABI281_06015 [Caldimonas sp.]